MDLHLLLEVDYLLDSPRERTADVDHVENLKRAGLKRLKILIKAAQRRGANRVPADVENNIVPIHIEGRGDLSREGQRLNTGAGKVRGDKADLLHLGHLAALSQAEICIDHIQIQKLRPSAGSGGVYCEIQGNFSLAAAVIANKNKNFFHTFTSCGKARSPTALHTFLLYH